MNDTGPSRVYDAICHLAAQDGVPPTHDQIAAHLGVSRQYVSAVFEQLVKRGCVVWRTRYTYSVPGAKWTPPDH